MYVCENVGNGKTIKAKWGKSVNVIDKGRDVCGRWSNGKTAYKSMQMLHISLIMHKEMSRRFSNAYTFIYSFVYMHVYVQNELSTDI